MTTTSNEEHLLVTQRDNVLEIQLNRPAKMNALTPEMIDSLDRIFAKAATDTETRCVLLTAAGKGFCAGRDLSTARADEPAERVLAETINPMLVRLFECAKPTIAAVNGPAMGIGLGLALACDITLAGTSARFSSPFAALGAALDSGGHYFLTRRLGEHRALEMIYTGTVVNGTAAAGMGLVNRVMPDSVLATTASEMARRLAAGPAAAFAGQKSLVRAAHQMTHTDICAAEARLQGELSHSPEYAEGLRAFQEKRPADFRKSSQG